MTAAFLLPNLQTYEETHKPDDMALHAKLLVHNEVGAQPELDQCAQAKKLSTPELRDKNNWV